jgi:uncharacterized membrane protein YphA (DoxX/SURF4 family)
LYFCLSALSKLGSGWLNSPLRLEAVVGRNLEQGTAEALYRPFLESIVLPHAVLFSQLVALGELAIGLSQCLGLLTRLGALGAAWLTLNFMLLKGLPNPAASDDRMFFLIALVFITTAAGMVWGLDGRWPARWATSPLLRWSAGLSDIGPSLGGLSLGGNDPGRAAPHRADADRLTAGGGRHVR